MGKSSRLQSSLRDYLRSVYLCVGLSGEKAVLTCASCCRHQTAQQDPTGVGQTRRSRAAVLCTRQRRAPCLRASANSSSTGRPSRSPWARRLNRTQRAQRSRRSMTPDCTRRLVRPCSCSRSPPFQPSLKVWHPGAYYQQLVTQQIIRAIQLVRDVQGQLYGSEVSKLNCIFGSIDVSGGCMQSCWLTWGQSALAWLV